MKIRLIYLFLRPKGDLKFLNIHIDEPAGSVYSLHLHKKAYHVPDEPSHSNGKKF